MNDECLIQWNRLCKEAPKDFPREKFLSELQAWIRENPENGEKNVRTTLRSIREALRCGEHEDEVVRHKARKLIRSCRHSFDEVRKNAGHFRQELAEARERRADAEAAPGTIPLGGGFRLEEVLSLKKLMAIGKALKICARKREDAQDYLKLVESGKSSLWLLLKNEEPFAMLTIGLEENKVREFSAHDNCYPDISFDLAMKILHELGVTADGVDSFARVGAYGRFKGGRPEVEPVRVDEQEMWIWLYEDELIVGIEEHADGRLYWSRFELKLISYDPHVDLRMTWEVFTRAQWEGISFNHLSMEMLFEIVRRNPHVLERFRSPVIAEPAHVRKAG